MADRRLVAPGLDFDRLRAELDITADFPAAVTAEAAAVTDRYAARRVDRRDLELVTVDPPGSKDLDQAMRLVPDGDGYLVHYAIADVAALVTPGSALDVESRRRGATIYFPDGNVPLHPRVLSEGLGSLLPDQDRAAVLWTVHVTGDGEVASCAVERATVRSRARLDYGGVYDDIVAGTPHPSIAGLRDFGELRQQWSLARGAVMLELPDQEVAPHRDPRAGRHWDLRLAPRTPADGWNAQVSLLVGMCAGTMMARADIGFLRTLPGAGGAAVAELRRAADSLGATWPSELTPGQFLATLAPDEPSTLALMTAGARLMRGAGYRSLPPEVPVEQAALIHAGVGGLYAHVTAPLRRLADRFATEVCLSVAAGEQVPDWVRAALPGLGKVMRSADAIGATANRRSIDLAEAAVLADQVGSRFAAIVLRPATEKREAEIFVAEPAIIAPCAGAPAAGQRCTVEVVAADATTGTVGFAAR
ncbi:MAG: RNB domain-containing ribonuclease [Gordonia sp. (in: high G+C Gram-positive bacteria)]|uniref:RNB domain-containing ribonuclease n=1 Tax=Gordonia sp. (in: high G+C Gram-positive bacteria) TaxID=84139 RepID=UPI003BB6C40A